MARFCSKCGASVMDGVKFCQGCGNVMDAAPKAAEPQSQATVPGYGNNNYVSSTGGSGFVSNNEESTGYSLRNGMGMNFLSGEGLKIEDAVITNKRIYYTAKDGIITVTKREEVVDLADVTGVKILDIKPYGLLIGAAIFFIVSLIVSANAGKRTGAIGFISFFITAVICVGLFFIAKKSILRIEYAGGNINFSVKKYGLDAVRNFQRKILEAKENLNK